jgi:hypothetical protein
VERLGAETAVAVTIGRARSGDDHHAGNLRIAVGQQQRTVERDRSVGYSHLARGRGERGGGGQQGDRRE